jgi:hypothetical protein
MVSHHIAWGSMPGDVTRDPWCTKWHWGMFLSVSSVSPAKYHSTIVSYLSITAPLRCAIAVTTEQLIIISVFKFGYYYYYGCTALCWALAAFLVSWSYTQSAGLLVWGSARRKASTYTQNKINTEQTHTIQRSMPSMGFETKSPAFERAKTVH